MPNHIGDDVKTVKEGYRMMEEEVRIVNYVDDIVLIAQTKDDHLQQIAISKTKATTINKELQRCKLDLEDHIIK